MRWFKHMTGSHNDEALCRMMDEFGLEGYGAYWIVLETIAAQCDKSDKTSITLSVKNWRKIVPFAPQKLTKWLAFAEQLTLFCVEIHENLITVSCPKLLKYRDEYSERRAKKSGECRDNIPPDTDTDTDLDKEKDKDITPPSPLSGGCASGCDDPLKDGQPESKAEEKPAAPSQKTKREDKPKTYHPDFEAIWFAAHELMRRCGKKAAGASWEKARKDSDYPGQESVMRALNAYRAEQEAKVDPKVCHLSVWLNQGRWNTGQDVEAHEVQGRAHRNAEREAAQRREEESEQRRKDADKAWAAAWDKLADDVKESWREHVVEHNSMLAQAKEKGQTGLLDIMARSAWRKHKEDQIKAQRAA